MSSRAALHLLALTTLILCTRSQQLGTVLQVPAPNGRVSAVRAAYNTYLKYNAVPPAALQAAIQSGTVSAQPVDAYDDAYVEAVTIGNQNLMLDFDTGSSDLWVFSTSLPANEVMGQTVFNPNTSPTFKTIPGETWSITYGDGSSSGGYVGADKVVVGGATVTSQNVELATQVSSSFTNNAATDGLLGLAFDTLNTCSPNRCETFFDNLAPSLQCPYFAADLRYHAAGAYDFGYLDSTRYVPPIAYMPSDNTTATTQGFWGFSGTGYAVGCGADVPYAIRGAIADTGTTLLYTDAAIVQSYYLQVPGAAPDAVNAGGLYTFPCTSATPDLTFVFGGYRATVPGKYINYEPLGNGNCIGGLQIATFGVPMSIFGDVFLKSQYVVFDTCGPALGFAGKANAIADQSTSCPGTTRAAATGLTTTDACGCMAAQQTSTSTTTTTAKSTTSTTSTVAKTTSSSSSSTSSSRSSTSSSRSSSSSRTSSSSSKTTSTKPTSSTKSTTSQSTLATSVRTSASACARDACYSDVKGYTATARGGSHWCHSYTQGDATTPTSMSSWGGHRVTSACKCLATATSTATTSASASASAAALVEVTVGLDGLI